MIGRKFGRLTVLEWVASDNSRHSLWRTVCSCGRVTVLRGSDLHSGHSKSCGCCAAAVEAALSSAGKQHGSSNDRDTIGERLFVREICGCDLIPWV
jgi:hypothetical protein